MAKKKTGTLRKAAAIGRGAKRVGKKIVRAVKRLLGRDRKKGGGGGG